MQTAELDTLRYPIGRFVRPAQYSTEVLEAYINEIASFPTLLRQEVAALTDAQLALTYRPGGWNIRQVVHHCADSHMNSFVRFKLALTEESPTIKPYEESLWAELPDTLAVPVEPSLQILEGLHQRWTVLLHNLTPAEWKKSFVHPEHGRHITLEEATGIYAWHCQHHLAHIKLAKGA